MNGDEHVGNFIAINIILAAIGILSLAASFSPGWHLWGLDHVAYFPLWLRISLVVTLLVFCIPLLSSSVAGRLYTASMGINGRGQWIKFGLITGIMILLFILFSSRNHFLGDGFVIQGTIGQGEAFSPTEPLDYFLHHLIFSVIGGENGAHLSYIITSYLTGAAFLFILFFFLRQKVGFIFSVAVALTFGVMQYFFGYVENYTISFILIIIFLILGWRDLTENKVSAVTIITLVLAICFQISTAVFLVPLGYLFLNKYKSRRFSIVSIIALLCLLILGIAYLRSFTTLNIFEIFVPPVPTPHNPYYLFSGAHLWDFLNICLLSFPLLLICPFIIWKWDYQNRIYFLWTVIPPLLYIFIIDPRLGAPRDWDMLSLPAAPVMIAIMLSFARSNGSEEDCVKWGMKRFGVIIPLLAISFLLTGSWIGQNSSKEAGYARLKQLIIGDPHYSSEYFHGYRNKSWATIVSKYTEDEDEIVRSDEIRYRGDPDDTLNTYLLATHYMSRSQISKAMRIVNDNWRRLSYNPYAAAAFGQIMYDTKHYAEAESIYCISLKDGNAFPRILYGYGVLLDRRGESDSANVCYNKAFEGWPDAPLGWQLSFYLNCVTDGRISMAQSGLKRTLPRLPDYAISPVTEIIAALDAGNKLRADSLTWALNNKLAAAGKL